jgi:hypothetical protein
MQSNETPSHMPSLILCRVNTSDDLRPASLAKTLSHIALIEGATLKHHMAVSATA